MSGLEDIYRSDLTIDAILAEQEESRRRSKSLKFTESHVRNVLVCGKTRSGKTTAIRVLKDSAYQPEKSEMFSDKNKIRFESLILKTPDIVDFSIFFVDTSGLFETFGYKEIEECMRRNIATLNTLLLFSGNKIGFDKAEVDMIEIFVRMFSGSGIKIILCITHAENCIPSKMAQIEEDYKRHPVVGPLMLEFAISLAFIGCVETDSYFTVEELRRAYKRVEKLRSDLISLIIKSSNSVPVEILGIFREHKQEMNELVSRVKESFEKISTIIASSHEGELELEKHFKLMSRLDELYHLLHPLKAEKEFFKTHMNEFLVNNPSATKNDMQALVGELIKIVLTSQGSFSDFSL